jgi:hypothetical protein
VVVSGFEYAHGGENDADIIVNVCEGVLRSVKTLEPDRGEAYIPS